MLALERCSSHVSRITFHASRITENLSQLIPPPPISCAPSARSATVSRRMEPVVEPEAAPETSAATKHWIHPAVTALFLAAWAIVVLQSVFRIPAFDSSRWPEKALVLAATAATLFSLARELP